MTVPADTFLASLLPRQRADVAPLLDHFAVTVASLETFPTWLGGLAERDDITDGCVPVEEE